MPLLTKAKQRPDNGPEILYGPAKLSVKTKMIFPDLFRENHFHEETIQVTAG